MQTTAKDYWKLINARIKELGTTQEALCRKTGIKYQTFRGMVTKGVFPRLNDAAAIADVLKLSIDYTYTQKDTDAAACFFRRFSRYENLLEKYESLPQTNKNVAIAVISVLEKC